LDERTSCRERLQLSPPLEVDIDCISPRSMAP
jgi:hypothetical protein